MRPGKRLAILAATGAALLGGAVFAPVASATTTAGGSERRASLLRLWLERVGGDRGGSVDQPGADGSSADGGASDGASDGGAASGGGAGASGGGAGASGGGAGASGGGAAPGGDASGDCDAVTVIAARGTGEPAGTGFLLGQVARQIDNRVAVPVTVVGLNYPAAAEFVNSPRQGVAELNRLVTASDGCLVLLGYSQGAIVVGDALAGFSAANGAKVRAAVMFGDPRFNSVEPYNLGTFGKPSRGLNPRRTGELAAFNDRIQDYCNGGDLVCQGSGRAGGDGHLAYGQFAAQAATFVAGRA